ncbi:hypothetical protein PBRA_005281 [Plasmodiophora brassicae]|nr:hypothetical protein PBRA_005281 [Plasmodiophora brassicae]
MRRRASSGCRSTNSVGVAAHSRAGLEAVAMVAHDSALDPEAPPFSMSAPAVTSRKSPDGALDFSSMPRKDFYGHKKSVHSVAWNCTGAQLASGSVDHSARIWTLDTTGFQSKAIELKGHEATVNQLCWSPISEHLLATASTDKTVRIWDIKAGKIIKRVETKGANINISWSPDGNYIAVGDKNDTVSIIDFGLKQIIGEFPSDNEVNELAWSRDSSALLFSTGKGKGVVEIHTVVASGDPPAVKLDLVHAFEAHTGQCYCVSFSPCYRYLATGGADAVVCLWDTEDLVCLRAHHNLELPVRTLSFSHDSMYLASGSEDHRIDICRVDTGEHAYTIPCSAAMNSIAWNPRYHILAFAGDDPERHEGSMTADRLPGGLSLLGLPDRK